MATTRLLAGASGFSFKEWRGSFYPREVRPEGMLSWYAERLPTVEINNTFYRMPRSTILDGWAFGTPEHFQFAIKAPRRITHLGRLATASVGDAVGHLYRSLTVLGRKRGPVLFQLPPSMKKDLPRLVAFLALLPEGHGAAFEFRDESWFSDEVYGALKQHGAALCLSEREGSDRPRLGDCPVGLRPPAAGTLLGGGPGAVGSQACRDGVARNLCLLHARANGALLRPRADAVVRLPMTETKEPGPLSRPGFFA